MSSENYYKRELILSIIRIGRVDIDTLSKSLRISKESVEKLLGELEISGYIDRISLATKYISLGGDPEKISQYLSWRDFEEFAMKILEEYNYLTAHSIRIPPPRGAEIDILALDPERKIALVIDCKHWRRTSGYMLNKFADELIEKIDILSKRCFVVARRYPWIYEARYTLPVIVTLHETIDRKIRDNVLLLPIAFFRDFFNNIDYYLDVLEIKPIKISCGSSLLEKKQN